jgi:hypothetical protein
MFIRKKAPFTTEHHASAIWRMGASLRGSDGAPDWESGLKAEPEEHMARARRQGDLRPMADDRPAMAELRTILLSRESLYARAVAVVDTSGLSVDRAAARLIETVAPVLSKDAHAFGLQRAAS